MIENNSPQTPLNPPFHPDGQVLEGKKHIKGEVEKNDRIVLIGGSGFIGTAVAQALIANGFRNITSLSRREPKHRQSGIKYCSGVDITKPESLLPHLQNAKVVINFAGLVSFAKHQKADLKKINAEGARNIARLCCQVPSIERLIHISSTAALGFGKKQIDESHGFEWNNHQRLHYSHSKHLANTEIDSCELKTNIIFPALVLGADDEANTGMLFRYLLNKKFVLSPPGKNSVIDVRDLASAIVLVLTKAPPNQNFIIAAKSHTFAEIFASVCEILGQKTRIVVMPRFMKKIAYFGARLLENHIRELHAENVFLGFEDRQYNTEKIQKLGFVPRYSLKDSLREYWSNKKD